MVTHSKPVTHLTIDERVAKGKAQRKQVPRKSHGTWTPPVDRRGFAVWVLAYVVMTGLALVAGS